MLGELNAAGCRLFLATSKPTVFARRIVDHFGLSGYFAGVYGSELDGRLENKGDLIRFVLAEEGIAADDAAMIGDRSHDVVGAKANGVFAVGGLWGYGSREELEGADVRCDNPDEVVHFLVGQRGGGPRRSPGHLPDYLDEMTFRFNNRDNPFLFRDTLMKLIEAPVLEYKKLTAAA